MKILHSAGILYRPLAVTLATAAALVMAALLLAGQASAGSKPKPGAPGLGDRLAPRLGNGGYDVTHYDLSLRYATSDPAQAIDGNESITAQATQPLSRFDLDFGGDSVGSVSVDGHQATFTRRGDELVITPSDWLRKGATFVVTIADFTATPTEPTGGPASTAFFITPDGSATAPQPYYAHLVYPCNDHPRDKATFTVRFDVPAGTTAVANGAETDHHTTGGRSYWTYEMTQPMATELTQLAVGNWDVATHDYDGITIRDVSPPSLTSFLQPVFALEPSQLDFMQQQVGTYPFDLYGTFVVDTILGFALETQTISLYDIPWFTAYPQAVWDPVMTHELAHQWFGDSVSPWTWSDVWLNEGHATWYEYLYAESVGELEDDTGFSTFDDLMQSVYSAGNQYRHDWGPVARPKYADVYRLFNPNVYEGGALVLYALRQQIGADAFQQVERMWVQHYEGASASTDDFITLASQVSGQKLKSFLRAWLYGTKTPRMPGHPDWTVDPATKSAAPPARSPRF